MSLNPDSELLMEVLDFIRQYPDRRHYVVCRDSEYVGEAVRKLQLPTSPFIEFIHLGRALTGWSDISPNCALCCTQVITDPHSYAMLCSRLRNDDSKFHIRARFSFMEPNALSLSALYPALFMKVKGDSYAYSDLEGFRLLAMSTFIKIGTQNGNS